MAFVANVFRVLVAASRDAVFEQNTIARSIHDWNAQHAHSHGALFLPLFGVGLSANSRTPAPPLSEIDADGFDLSIAAFRRDTASVLGNDVSHAIALLRRFRDQRRSAMLFFSELSGPNDSAMMDFQTAAHAFEMAAAFRTSTDLAQSVAALLTRRADGQRRLSSNTVNWTDDGAVHIERYTPRSFVVLGNTRIYKDELRKQNGRWIRLRDGRSGWMFSERRRATVTKIIGL